MRWDSRIKEACAGPWPILRTRTESRSNGILMYIPYSVAEVSFVADKAIPVVPHPEMVFRTSADERDPQVQIIVVRDSPSPCVGFP